MAASPRKKSTTTKSSAKKASSTRGSASKGSARKSAARKAPARKSTARKAPARAADRGDKSVEAFRDALERSVTISRDRIQEIVDDAVKRGRMTRADANDLVSKLVSRGRKQTEDLLKELERTLEQARKEVEGRTGAARKRVETQTAKARKRVESETTKARKRVESETSRARKRGGRAAGRASKRALAVADEPLAQADKLRRQAKIGSFPITAYDELTAAQVKSRLSDLTKAELRKVRTYENRNKSRKRITDEIEKQLAR